MKLPKLPEELNTPEMRLLLMTAAVIVVINVAYHTIPQVRQIFT